MFASYSFFFSNTVILHITLTSDTQADLVSGNIAFYETS